MFPELNQQPAKGEESGYGRNSVLRRDRPGGKKKDIYHGVHGGTEEIEYREES